jgi:cell division protein FtsZ
VIINVTGGSDLSLVEVSEASAIIQEAAHEEANIIFGAVVDQKMAGKVKITVIATGFERPAAGPAQVKPPVAATATPTPVDLSSYTNWKQDAGERPAPAGPRMSLSRRSVLEIPPAAAKAVSGGDPLTPGAEFEPVSPLDVPAFLRRQSEG